MRTLALIAGLWLFTSVLFVASWVAATELNRWLDRRDPVRQAERICRESVRS